MFGLITYSEAACVFPSFGRGAELEDGSQDSAGFRTALTPFDPGSSALGTWTKLCNLPGEEWLPYT